MQLAPSKKTSPPSVTDFAVLLEPLVNQKKTPEFLREFGGFCFTHNLFSGCALEIHLTCRPIFYLAKCSFASTGKGKAVKKRVFKFAPQRLFNGVSLTTVTSLSVVSLFGVLGCKKFAPKTSIGVSSGSRAQEMNTGFHLDNLQEIPSNSDREFTCPVKFLNTQATVNGKTLQFEPASKQAPTVHSGALNAITDPFGKPSVLKVTAILVRRIGGVPHYLYLSNGAHNDNISTWSSSKHLAFGALASRLRKDSKGSVGIDGLVNYPRQADSISVGDLMTYATTYRVDSGVYSSNDVSTWALGVAGRKYSTDLIQTWLERKSDFLKSGWGGFPLRENNSTRSSFAFKNSGGALFNARLQGDDNNSRVLSTQTMAEFLRRLIMHRENPEYALPFATWSDVKTILYGAEKSQSKFFKDRAFGGLAGGTGTFLQQAVGAWRSNILEKKTGGNWRTFSKIGWGPSNDINGAAGFDFVWHGYGCLPKFRTGELETPTGGHEFIVSASLSGSPLRKDDAVSDVLFAKIMKEIASNIVSGKIDGSFENANGEIPAAVAKKIDSKMGPLECPTDFKLTPVGQSGGRACLNDAFMAGPFTAAMILKCQELGDKKECAQDKWSKSQALALRGTESCPLGANFDADTGYCAENGAVFGPFPKELQDKCLKLGVPEADCRLSVWGQGFLSIVQKSP